MLDPFGTVIVTAPVGVGTGMRGAEDSLGQCHRQVEVDIVSFTGEERVRLDCDLNQHVAWLAVTDARLALAAQPEDLAVLDSSWNCHIESSPVRQCQPLGRARDCLEELDRQVVAHIGPAGACMCGAP